LHFAHTFSQSLGFVTCSQDYNLLLAKEQYKQVSKYMFFSFVQLQCGVRQGGVLSPVLFAVSVNDVILALSKSGHVTLIICLLGV